MRWTRSGCGHWPACPPPDARLDLGVERMLYVAFLDQPGLLAVLHAHLGVGSAAGNPPVSMQAATGGVSRSRAELLRARLREVACAVGPPTVLPVALRAINRALPASDGRLAALLVEAGLTEKP